MFRNGGVVVRKVLVILVLLVAIVAINSLFSSEVMAYVVGQGGSNSGGSCGKDNLNSIGHWDTCFGLSWQYYEWPKENGNPIDGTISFFCGPDVDFTGAGGNNIGCLISQLNSVPNAKIIYQDYGGKRYRRLVIDPVQENNGRWKSGIECKNEGGFWFLGYQVYSPKTFFKLENGVVTSTNNTNIKNIGAQVGRPSVDMLFSSVNMINPTNPSAGLYPFGLDTGGFAESGFYPKDMTVNGVFHQATTHQQLKAGGIVPPTSSSDGGNYNNPSNYWNPIQPIISSTTKSGTITKVSGTPQVVYAKYFAGTQEVYRHWRRVTENLSASFSVVNWFCAGNPEEAIVYGKVKAVENGNTSNAVETSWDESNTSVNLGEVLVTADNTSLNAKKITFQHSLKEVGDATYSISKTDTIARSKDDVTNYRYVPLSDGSESLILSRTADLTYDSVTNGQKVCDVLTYTVDNDGGSYTRKACFTVKKQTELPGTSSYSAIKENGKSSWTYDTTSDGKSETITVNVPVDYGTKSVKLDFDHHITASGVGKADVVWVVSQSNPGVTVSQNHAANDTRTISLVAGSPNYDQSVDSSTITVSGISATTDATVCQSLKTTYKGERTTTVCARIVGSQVGLSGHSSFSAVRKSGASWKYDNASDNKAETVTIPVMIQSGSTSVEVDFAHYATANSSSHGYGKANVTWSVTQGSSDNSYQRSNTASYTNPNNPITLTISPTTPSSEVLASSSTVKVSGITSGTDVTVCESFVTTYKTSRTTQVCARIIGSAFRSSSGVKAGSDSSYTTTATDGQTADRGTITVTVVPGSTGTLKLTFRHQVGLLAGTGSQSATIKSSVSQSVSNSTATVTTFNNVNDKETTVTTSAQNLWSEKDASGPTEITVSGITKNTNIKVCQTHKATYNGATRTTTACATVKGVENTVKSQSSVGATSAASDAQTELVAGNNTTPAQPGTYKIYMPYRGSSTKTIYFEHKLKGERASGAVDTGSVKYWVLRGSDYVKNETTIDFSRISGSTATSVYTGSASVKTGSTLCQIINYEYGTATGSSKACATVAGLPPAVRGSSTIWATGVNPQTASSKGESKSINTEVKMALGKTASADIHFKHTVIAETTENGANDKSTGNIPYEIKNEAGGSVSGEWSGTFPSSYTNGKVTASGAPKGETTRTVTVGPVTVSNQSASKEICETLFIDTNVYDTKVCATVVGKLSMPNVYSRSGVSAKNSINAGDHTFTEWNQGGSNTFEVTREAEIIQAVTESQSLNNGVNVPVYFRHDIKTVLSELSEQLTGEVPVEIITTGATDNTKVTTSFSHIVKTLTPNQTAILPNATSPYVRYANVKCDYSDPDDIVCTNTTVCQELRFDYNNSHYSTKACAKVKAITADPIGTSKAYINGITGLADTNFEDGAISRISIDVTGRTLKGSDIMFDHGISIAGEQLIESLRYYIHNDCIEYGCDNDYDSSRSFTYVGGSNTSRAKFWLYRKLDSNNHLTNVYQRPKTITDDDAKKMQAYGSVCETLSFYYDGAWHHSTACIDFVDRTKDICEDVSNNVSNTGGTTSSKSYVKKYLSGSNSSPTPNKTQTIYAKPTDKIIFTHCYYPGAQATRYTNYDESEYKKPENNGKIVQIPMRNSFVETVNEFTIVNKSGTDTYVSNSNKFAFANYDQKMAQSEQDGGRAIKFTGVVGNANKTSIESSSTNITTSAVGGTIRQSLFDHPGTNSVIGHNTADCGSGCLVTYRNDGDNKWYNIGARTTNKAASESSYAEVIVPYNYNTTASINTGDGYVYAGESISGKQVSIIVNKRQNNTVNDNYATKTAESSVRLFMFYSTNGNQSEGSDSELNGSNPNICNYYNSNLGFSNCVELAAEKATTGLVFNKNSLLNGSTESLDAFKSAYNVPDIAAGSKVCMGVAVYPSASTDLELSNGKTYVSKAYCRIVAKKPSFQIWGGSLYSSGNVSARTSTKYVIDGIYTFSPIRQNDAPNITFGSWVEQSIISNGLVTGVASGAATGYGETGLVVNTTNPGGIKNNNNNYCNLSRLSFSNVNCATGMVGQFGLAGDSTTEGEYKQRYANKAAEKDTDRNSNKNTYVSVNLSTAYTAADGVRYTYASGSLAISASQRLGQGITHVVYVKGNVIITGNSLLYNNGNYQRLNQVPQYIVFAEGNIYIDPSVTRVDAILIAGKNINTCAKLSGGSIVEAKKAANGKITDLYCSKQLKINGIVIADTLKLYRIGGASTGLNSIAPAEIIDYTPNVYFWGSNESTSSSKGVYTTYQRELAPRQ